MECWQVYSGGILRPHPVVVVVVIVLVFFLSIPSMDLTTPPNLNPVLKARIDRQEDVTNGYLRIIEYITWAWLALNLVAMPSRRDHSRLYLAILITLAATAWGLLLVTYLSTMKVPSEATRLLFLHQRVQFLLILGVVAAAWDLALQRHFVRLYLRR